MKTTTIVLITFISGAPIRHVEAIELAVKVAVLITFISGAPIRPDEIGETGEIEIGLNHLHKRCPNQTGSSIKLIFLSPVLITFISGAPIRLWELLTNKNYKKS